MKKTKVIAMLSLTLAGILPLPAQAAKTIQINPGIAGQAAGSSVKVIAGTPKEVKAQLEAMGIKCEELGTLDCPFIQIPCFPETPDTPDADKPETPDTDTPDTDTPDTDVPDTDTPDTDTPDTDVPDTDKPDTPDTDVPDTDKPDTPDTDVPDTDKPDTPDTAKPDTPDTDTPDQDDTQELSEYVREVARLVNEERKKNGLSALELRVDISKAAQIRAAETEVSFSHTRPDGRSFSSVLNDNGISYRMSGENIAWGQKTPEEVMIGWMNSEGHRANILNPNYTSIGIGYYQNARGVNYWTQIFTA